MTKPKLADFHDQEIEPEALCRNCEYFDCEGKDPRTLPDDYKGDCLSRSAPYFQAFAHSTCKHFWPDSSRWPDCDHD